MINRGALWLWELFKVSPHVSKPVGVIIIEKLIKLRDIIWNLITKKCVLKKINKHEKCYYLSARMNRNRYFIKGIRKYLIK